MGRGSAVDSHRRHSSSVGRLVCGFAAVMALMAAVPAVASAQTITSVRLLPPCPVSPTPNGTGAAGSTVPCPFTAATNVPPDGPAGLTAYRWRITATTTSGVRSVRYSFNSDLSSPSACINAVGSNASAAVTSFTVTAPTGIVLPSRSAGTYPLYVQAWVNVGCSGAASNIFALAIGAIVTAATAPAPNPGLTAECGLKVQLVLDASTSILNFGAVDEVRAAAATFVRSLNGTGSRVAITAFGNTAADGVVPYQEVNTDTLATFTNWINNVNGNGYRVVTNTGTNTEDAFLHVPTVTGGPPDLVVFVTDGDPTIYNTSLGAGTAGIGSPLDPIGLDRAVAAANAVKRLTTEHGHSHIFVVGVGPDVTNAASGAVARIKELSGPHEFPEHADFRSADFTLVKQFGQLEASLTHIVAALCGGTLTVTKYVYGPPPGEAAEASGWSFTATMTQTSPGHVWLTTPPLAPPADTAASLRETTNGDGQAEFRWKLTGLGDAHVRVTEESKRGYHLVLALCDVTSSGGGTTQTGERTIGTTITENDLVVPPKGHATCSVWNRRTTAHLTIIKRLRPIGDPGLFDLLVNGAAVRENVGTPGGSTGRMSLPILRTYGVGEAAVPPTDLVDYDTATRCVNYNGTEPRPTVSGVGTESDPVSVRLRSATDNWVCWITNVSNRFGNLTVTKHLVPSDAPGAFDLFVGTTDVKTGARDGQGGGLTHIPFGDYTVSEAVSAGQTVTLADFEISISCVNETADPAEELPGFPVAAPTASVTLSRGQSDIACTITNVHIPTPVAHLEVVKHLVPSEDAGLFDLRIDGTAWASGVGDGGSTGSLPFEFGTYNVSESATAGTATNLADYDISTTCVNSATGHTVQGVGTSSNPVSVTLASDTDNVVCTITNTRKSPPVEPEGGGAEPDVCNDVDDGIPQCGNLADAPRLFVIKQMPAQARVGDRVPVTITVINTGHATAVHVELHETPAPSGRIVGVADHGLLRSDGTVVWHLGNLAPGASRTVHATLLVTATGVLSDTAVAHAGNVNPAFDTAPVHASGPPPAPPPPAVTG